MNHNERKHRLANWLVNNSGKANSATMEHCLSWAEQDHHHLLFIDDPEYPEALKQIHNPPPLLFVNGNLANLGTPILAMVGSRQASHDGFETAFRFARLCAEAGLTICSGLAQGIDTASHRGALAANGRTIAVLGTGIDIIYPSSNAALAQQISNQGTVVSEFPIGTAPHAWNFPRRNRIISGLSLGILVVEASLQSGSLITARYGLEQGREIFAIPGSIHNPTAKGCHHLLREGAQLVETIDDILAALPNHTALQTGSGKISSDKSPRSEGHFVEALDPQGQKLVECVGSTATSLDLIVERSQLPASKIAAQLSQLELKQFIKAVPGGYMRIKYE